MMDIEIDDKIFNPLSLYSVHIHEKMITDFKRQVSRDDFPNEFVLELVEGRFKINKVKKEFRILERFKCGDFEDTPYTNDFEIELQVFIAYKVAKLSAFNVFLEPKYSN
jgi:hypothetical protein